jgi:hypothetical protein
MSTYCELWKLQVSTAKTKVVFFCRNIPSFYFNIVILDIVEDFSYLHVGWVSLILMESSIKLLNTFVTKLEKLCLLYLKIQNSYLDLDLQLQLFDSMVTPILLYGVEVWGVGNIDIVKQFQLKYHKLIMNVTTSTPSVMVFWGAW